MSTRAGPARLSIAVAVSLQIGGELLSHLLVVRMVGVGSATDAYVAALAVPAVLGGIIAAALQSVWLQRFAVLGEDGGDWRREQATAQGQGLLLAGGGLLVMWSTEAIWLPWLFPGLQESQYELIRSYSPALMLAAAINTLSGLHTAALRARGRFVPAEWIAASGTALGLLALVAALPRWGLQAAVCAVLGRAALVYGLLLLANGRPPLSLSHGWRSTVTWRLVRPLLFGSSVYKTAPLVDRYWASQAGMGGITTLSLAQTAMTSLTLLLERVLFVPEMPRLARLASDRQFAELRRMCRVLLGRAALVTVMVLAIMGLGGEPIAQLIAWAFSTDGETAGQVWLFALLLLGHVYAGMVGPYLVSIFYALGDTRTPVYIGLAGFLLGLLLKWAFFAHVGLPGLAIASSMYFLLSIVLFLCILNGKTSEPVQTVPRA